MDSFITILGAIIVLFFLILMVKQLFPKKSKEKICVLCVSVVITWFVLLILYWLGKFYDLLIIALLMGGSVLGLFYTMERNVKKDLTFFRLPFFLTLLFISWFLLTFEIRMKSLLLLVVLWFVFLIIYFYRKNKKINSFVNKIVECCKKW